MLAMPDIYRLRQRRFSAARDVAVAAVLLGWAKVALRLMIAPRPRRLRCFRRAAYIEAALRATRERRARGEAALATLCLFKRDSFDASCFSHAMLLRAGDTIFELISASGR